MNIEEFQRPTKFRVWFNKEKRWIHGPHERNDMDGVNLFGETILFGALLDGISIEDLNDCVSLQYTGLNDINGKNIFEGDILASRANEKPCNYLVKWSTHQSNYCGFILNPVMKDPPRVTFHIHDFQSWMAHAFEVIGNIFDNPELLTLPPKELPPLPPLPDQGPAGSCVNGCGSEACDNGKCSSCGGECKSDFSRCEQCDEEAWDGRICHSCGAKHI
jgi:uncharacterized phage protein (TIGR01671 family)